MIVREELLDFGGAAPQEGLDSLRGTVPKTHPHNFGRITLQKASLAEIGVLGDDDETILGAYCQIVASVASRSPTSRTWVALGKRSTRAPHNQGDKF